MRSVSRCHGFSSGEFFSREIEQVLLRQLGVGVEFRVGIRRRRRGGRFDAGGQRAPELAIGLLLVCHALAVLFQHALLRRPGRAAIAKHPLVHQRVRRIEHRLDLVAAVTVLAGGDVALGEGEIIEDALRIRPLAEEVVVLEEMIVPERGMRHHQRLHRHRVLFEQVGDAGAGIDHDLVGERGIAGAVHRLLAREQLAEGPVIVHQRHGQRRIGVQHLLRRDDLDLVGIDVEAEILERDLLDRGIGAVEGGEVPICAVEQQFAHGPPPPCGEVEKCEAFFGGGRGARRIDRPPPEALRASTSPQGGGKKVPAHHRRHPSRAASRPPQDDDF